MSSPGNDVAISDINGNGLPDIFIIHVDDPSGQNSIYYRIGWDVDTNGNCKSWSTITNAFSGIGNSTAEAGVAIGDINRNGKYDVAVFYVDDPSGENYLRYRIGWDLNSAGVASSWGPILSIPGPVGHYTSGAGITFGDIDKNNVPDLFIYFVDNPSGADIPQYRVGWNLSLSGVPTAWSEKHTLPRKLGDSTSGAGISLVDLNKNGSLDLVQVWTDNPSGQNSLKSYITWDISTNGVFSENVSNTITLGSSNIGNETQGTGIASYLNPDGTFTFVASYIDNPSGENAGYIRVSSLFSNNAESGFLKTIFLSPLEDSYGVALGALPEGPNPFVQSNILYGTNPTLQFGVINHSSQTWFELKNIKGTSISFYTKVSSEENYDKLNVYIDGTLTLSVSGEKPWTKQTLNLVGSGIPHTIRWEYKKDSAVSKGSDAAWIYGIEIK